MKPASPGQARSRLRLLAAVAALTAGLPALAQSPPSPFVVYDDELKNDWQNWSWAKVDVSAPVGAIKPLKVQGDAWSALALHHEAFSTAPYSRVSFYINGGMEGGQSLSVKILADGKAIESNYVIQPKAKSWAVVVVPLKELAADNKTIDGLWVQGAAASYKPYYITRIQFE